MTITHPLSEVCEQIEKAFDAIENGTIPENQTPVNREAVESHTWFPNVMISEDEENFVVKVELSGIDPDEVFFRLADNSMIIGTKTINQEEDEEEPVDTNMVDEANHDGEEEESDYGEYLTEIPLPTNVKGSDVVVDLVEDELEIQLPKAVIAAS